MSNYKSISKVVHAIQHNKLGDHTYVTLGYYHKSTPETIIISASIPRSMDIVRCNVIILEDGHSHIVNDGDWIVTMPKGRTKLYSNKKFQKKYSLIVDPI